jgi:hypothetical protein
MKTFIKLFFQNFGIIRVISILGVLTFLFLINTNEIFMIMYQIIIIYFFCCMYKKDIEEFKLGISNNFLKELKILFSKVTYNYINVQENEKNLEYNPAYTGAGLLQGNVMVPVAFIVLISKTLSLFNLEQDAFNIYESFYDNFKFIGIMLVLCVILNLLLDKLNNKDSSGTSPKVGTSLPALSFGGDTGHGDSNDKDNDFTDNKENKSRWNKIKDFLYKHRVAITIVVSGVVVVIIAYVYGGTPPPIPPRNPGKLSLAEKQRLFLEQIQKISEFPWAKNKVEVNTYLNVTKVLRLISNTNPASIKFDYHVLEEQSVSAESFGVFSRCITALDLYIDKFIKMGLENLQVWSFYGLEESLRILIKHKDMLVKCQATLSLEDKTYAEVLWVSDTVLGIMLNMDNMKEFFIEEIRDAVNQQ